MTPYYTDDWLTVYHGDCREAMAAMDPESVNCVVTSPPYWGLRDYGTATWVGGDEACDHAQRRTIGSSTLRADGRKNIGTQPHEKTAATVVPFKDLCPKCGAIRQDSQLGLERTPEEYVANLVAVFREVRRVLRNDGTVWLNLGDSYATGAGSYRNPGSDVAPVEHGGKQAYTRDYARSQPNRMPIPGLKPKDRAMIPARVALALQADGWWLRDEIVWAKPNPMPSSVRDRTTPSHEMVYLLTKRGRYYYDGAAFQERGTTTRPDLLAFGEERPDRGGTGHIPDRRRQKVPGGWDIAEGSHGSVHRQGRTASTYRERNVGGRADGYTRVPGGEAEWQETGQPGRNKRSVWTIATQAYPEAHFATFPEDLIEPMILAGCPEGGTVLDPFAGSGTTGLVAQRLSRRAVLIDLSLDYLGQLMARNADIPLGLGA